MKKGFIFLLLVISFGVFGMGKANADTTLDNLNRQLSQYKGNYDGCKINGRGDPILRCYQQIKDVADAKLALADYNNVSSTLKDSMLVARNAYTTCMSNNKDDITKCSDQITKLNTEITSTGNIVSNTSPDLYKGCIGKTGADEASCRASALYNDCLNNRNNYGGGADACKTLQAGQDNAIKDQSNETLLKNTDPDLASCRFGITGSNFELGSCATGFITWFIKGTLIKYAQVFLYFAAMMLNKSMWYAIFDGSNSVSSVIDSLYPVWQTIRQLIDFCVLFATLYLGAMYIANIEAGKQFIEKHIPWLILFALFVNFSYPATKAAKDISNIISLKIYASTVGGETLNMGMGAGDAIMKKLGLPSLVGTVTSVDNSTATGGATDLLKNTQGPVPALLVFVMIMYISFIFIVISLMIIMSSIVCIFIITVSPILLIQKILPKLGEPASMLRKEFFSALALPVVFSLMFFLTTQIINTLSLTRSNAPGDSQTIVQIFNTVLMIASLYVMFKVTKSVSGKFGETVEGFGGKVAGMAMMATPAMAARATLGRLGSGMLNTNTAMGKWIDQNRGTALGDSFHKLGGGLANSTFDMRNTSAMGKLAGMGGVDMGKGSDTTYEKSWKGKQTELKRKVASTNDTEAKRRIIANAGRFSTLSDAEKTDLRKSANKTYDTDWKNLSPEEKENIEDKARDEANKTEDEKNEKIIEKYNKMGEKEEGFGDTRVNRSKQQYFAQQTPTTQKRIINEEHEEQREKARREEFDSYTNEMKKGIVDSDHEKANIQDIIINQANHDLKKQNETKNKEHGKALEENATITKNREEQSKQQEQAREEESRKSSEAFAEKFLAKEKPGELDAIIRG